VAPLAPFPAGCADADPDSTAHATNAMMILIAIL